VAETVPTDENFRSAYRALEARMKALAEDEENFYVPNPEPEGPVEYVLICMEPSLGRWAKPPAQAKARIEAGFRNFLPSDEIALLHFAVRHYLCEPEERYHITDLSKGAMLVKRSGHARAERYAKWYPLLQEEIELVAKPDARIIAVGKQVYQFLKSRGFGRDFWQVIHYSGQAGRARKAEATRQESSFKEFQGSVLKQDLAATAKEILTDASVPKEIREKTLSKLGSFSLTTSRQQLLFHYKLRFESIRGSGTEDG